jgi:hypothetical protein
MSMRCGALHSEDAVQWREGLYKLLVQDQQLDPGTQQ